MVGSDIRPSPRFGLETPETERIFVPAPEPLTIPQPQPATEPLTPR
jgi:hypothetical protein